MIINKEQKDPRRFILTEDRHEPRQHQIIFPGPMVTDLEIIVAKEIQLLEALEARLHKNLNDVIEIVRKFAGRAPLK